MQLVKEIQKKTTETQKVELADAHCHLDLVDDALVRSAIFNGVHTIITDGVNTTTSIKAIRLCNGRNTFAAVGIDPELAMLIGDKRLDTEINAIEYLARNNTGKVVAIGEIGLDYMKAKKPELVQRQRRMFERMLDLAKKLELPVSVHSRESIEDVLSILKEKRMQRVHLHFFEGNVQQAKEAERLGYMISIPPVESTKRTLVINDIAIDNLMAESDCPVVGATPLDVKRSIMMVAQAKRITFDKAAEILTMNTKRFFGIHAKLGFMRA